LIKGNARVNIKHFVESESEQLFQFLELKQPDDKSLHQLRKLIKNILYTWPFIRRDANILFPPGFSSYNHLKLISDLLGRFHDSCVDLTQLDSIIEDRSSFPKESKVLTEIKKEWEKDKAITRSVLMNKLNAPGDTGLFKGDRRQNST
ncbi:MAG: hypothetical protein ACHQET_12700, partial [Chitinophagales bacterium]